MVPPRRERPRRLRSAGTRAAARLLSPRARILNSETLARLLFERRLDVQTEGQVPLRDLGLANPHRIKYQPSPWLTLPRILKRAEVNADDVFIDFGCGKGRTVLEAALLYPFGRVIGVELSEELARVARENVERNRHRLRTHEVDIVTSDVLAYQPPEDVTVAYFYNPFFGPIFEHVVGELIASVDRVPRRLRIIYQNPWEEAMLLATGRIRRVGSGRSFRPGGPPHRDLALYEVDPPKSALPSRT